MSAPTDPVRRQLLVLAAVPDFSTLLKSFEEPPDSFSQGFRAVRFDDVRQCQGLLNRGFDPNTIEPERFDTALILAVREKSRKVLRLLLTLPDIALDARSRNGDTALMIAAFLSDQLAASALIGQGAEINRPGWTALHYAAASGSAPIVRLLLEQSAYIDAESPNKTTPLMMAARAGHLSIVQLLLAEGADVTLKNELGLTAADFARVEGKISLAALLQQAQLSAQKDASSNSPR